MLGLASGCSWHQDSWGEFSRVSSVVGNTVFDLTGPRFEPQTLRSRDERITRSKIKTSIQKFVEKNKKRTSKKLIRREATYISKLVIKIFVSLSARFLKRK